MTGPVELLYTAGDARRFIDDLWRHFPAHPDGPVLGVMHLVGDRGQIVVRLRAADVRELVVLPGQVLVAGDTADPGSWSVVDGPAPPRLKLP